MTDLLQPLPYKLPDIDKSLLINKLCYIYDAHPLDGVSMIIKLDKQNNIRFSDFNGNIINPTENELVKEILAIYGNKVINTMKLIHINKGIFYFVNDGSPKLVDVRISLNKFVSPGFMEDIFGKQGFKLPNKLDILMITDNVLCQYTKDIILKPSVFKFIVKDGEVYPFYKVIKHEVKPVA